MGVTTVIKDYGTEILNAIRENNIDRFKQILEKHLKTDRKISQLCVTDIKHKPSKKFACPLILAARQEDPRILKYMMDRSTDPNYVHHTIYSSKRREVVTALHIAVDLGYYDTVAVLLNANADCNIGDQNQETPLHIAVKKADRVMTTMLLSKGADPGIPDRKGNSPLHVATLYGHLQLVRSLLKYDADVYQKGESGAIPPHIAAKEGHIHLIQLFCSRDVGNINIKIPCYVDQREKAPIHLAAENGHVETVLALLDQFDAEVNLKCSDNNTPLHCVVLNPYDFHRMRDKEYFNETARVLIKYRVSINEKNIYGDTALHMAAMNHFQRIVELLLAVGANPFVENDEHLKPIDVVPDDDPVTKQVLKNAMLNPKTSLLNSSIDTIKRDPMADVSFNHVPPVVKKPNTIGGLINTSSSGTPEQAIDMNKSNMSIHSTSTISMGSVFEDSRHLPGTSRQPKLPPGIGQSLPEEQPQQRSTDQNTAENEIPLYTKVNKDRKNLGNKPKKMSDISMASMRKPVVANDNSFDDQASVSTIRTMDETNQTQSHTGHDTAALVNEYKQRFAKRQPHMSEDSFMTDTTSQASYSIHEEPRHPLQPPPPPPQSKKNKKKKKGKKQDDEVIYENVSASISAGQLADDVFAEDNEGLSVDQTQESNELGEYTTDPQGIRVHTVPGRPGTIEVQYEGGPITISVDTQNMNYDMQQFVEGIQTANGIPQVNQYDNEANEITPELHQDANTEYTAAQDYTKNTGIYENLPPRRNKKDTESTPETFRTQPKETSQDWTSSIAISDLELSQLSGLTQEEQNEAIKRLIQQKVYEVTNTGSVPSTPEKGSMKRESPASTPSSAAKKRSKKKPLPPPPPPPRHKEAAEEIEEMSPDISPNESPKHKSFSQRLAWAQTLQDKSGGQSTPEKVQTQKQKDSEIQGKAKKTGHKSKPEQQHTQDEQGVKATKVQTENKAKEKSYVKGRGKMKKGVPFFEPAHVSQNVQQDDNTVDIEEKETSVVLKNAAEHPHKSHDLYYKITPDIDVSSKSSTGSQNSVAKEMGEKKSKKQNIKISDPSKTETLQVEVVEEDESMEQEEASNASSSLLEYDKEPGGRKHKHKQQKLPQQPFLKQRLNRQEPTIRPHDRKPLSPFEPVEQMNAEQSNYFANTTDDIVTEELLPSSQTPNSPQDFEGTSEDFPTLNLSDLQKSPTLRSRSSSMLSEGSTRSGLNMRVTGEVPKAYSRATTHSARTAFIKATPVGIMSDSEASDTEFAGSRSSLTVSSPIDSERSKKWQEEIKPIYSDQSSSASSSFISTGFSPKTEHRSNKSKKLIGSYAKPYKSFGKIEVKTDALEDSLSPLSTSVDEFADEDTDKKKSNQELNTFSKDTSSDIKVLTASPKPPRAPDSHIKKSEKTFTPPPMQDAAQSVGSPRSAMKQRTGDRATPEGRRVKFSEKRPDQESEVAKQVATVIATTFDKPQEAELVETDDSSYFDDSTFDDDLEEYDEEPYQVKDNAADTPRDSPSQGRGAKHQSVPVKNKNAFISKDNENLPNDETIPGDEIKQEKKKAKKIIGMPTPLTVIMPDVRKQQRTLERHTPEGFDSEQKPPKNNRNVGVVIPDVKNKQVPDKQTPQEGIVPGASRSNLEPEDEEVAEISAAAHARKLRKMQKKDAKDQKGKPSKPDQAVTQQPHQHGKPMVSQTPPLKERRTPVGPSPSQHVEITVVGDAKITTSEGDVIPIEFSGGKPSISKDDNKGIVSFQSLKKKRELSTSSFTAEKPPQTDKQSPPDTTEDSNLVKKKGGFFNMGSKRGKKKNKQKDEAYGGVPYDVSVDEPQEGSRFQDTSRQIMTHDNQNQTRKSRKPQQVAVASGDRDAQLMSQMWAEQHGGRKEPGVRPDYQPSGNDIGVDDRRRGSPRSHQQQKMHGPREQFMHSTKPDNARQRGNIPDTRQVVKTQPSGSTVGERDMPRKKTKPFEDVAYGAMMQELQGQQKSRQTGTQPYSDAPAGRPPIQRTDDTQIMSQMWKERKEQEEEMQRMLQSMKNISEDELALEPGIRLERSDQPYRSSENTAGLTDAQRSRMQRRAKKVADYPQIAPKPGTPQKQKAEVVEMLPNEEQEMSNDTFGRRKKDRRWPTDDTQKGNLSDSEAIARGNKKSISFGAEAHSEGELLDVETSSRRDHGKSLQEAALESITSDLKEPKATKGRRMVDASPERPINYTRGVYRPQAMHWRGSVRGSTGGQYDDSELVSQLWSDRNKSAATESEGEADIEDVSYDPAPAMYAKGHPKAGSQGSAFRPVSPGGSQKRVTIIDHKPPRKKRSGGKRYLPPRITEPGPVDFRKYGATAKIWMEQVDKKTVQKSKGMYLSVLPEGYQPPEELSSKVNYDNTSDDVFLPPQWVVARGLSLRRRKRKLDDQAARQSSATSGSEVESESEMAGLSERPMSPGRQMLLFFRVGSNWKELAWVLFDGIQTDPETIRMVKDIELKNSGKLTEQVHDLMHRWWKIKGSSATIEELQRALDVVHMAYLKEDCLDQRGVLTSYTDTEDDLDISEVSDTDPEVNRLIQEYGVRSMNSSFDVESAPEGGRYSLSTDSIMRKLEQKGLTKIDRGRMDSSRESMDRSRTGSKYTNSRESLDYTSGDESKRHSFFIIQPQLKSSDYRHETNI